MYDGNTKKVMNRWVVEKDGRGRVEWRDMPSSSIIYPGNSIVTVGWRSNLVCDDEVAWHL